MSDAHDAHDHGGHPPEPAEITHPLLWTLGLVGMSLFLVWMFFHYYDVGTTHGRSLTPVPLLMQRSGPVEPDHAALIADRSQDVLDRGAAVYATACASCHGPTGNLVGGTSPTARNFHIDGFRNQLGGGPYALYVVTTQGFNGNAMPGFPGLSPQDRYAVVHFVREAIVKPNNAAAYAADDLPETKAKIPAPGAGGDAAAGPQLPPNERPAPVTLHPLMAVMSAEASERGRVRARWLDATANAAAPEARADVERLRELARAEPALGDQLRAAAAAGDRKRFATLLVAPMAPGADTSAFALMSDDRLGAVYQAARSAAQGSR